MVRSRVRSSSPRAVFHCDGRNTEGRTLSRPDYGEVLRSILTTTSVLLWQSQYSGWNDDLLTVDFRVQASLAPGTQSDCVKMCAFASKLLIRKFKRCITKFVEAQRAKHTRYSPVYKHVMRGSKTSFHVRICL